MFYMAETKGEGWPDDRIRCESSSDRVITGGGPVSDVYCSLIILNMAGPSRPNWLSSGKERNGGQLLYTFSFCLISD